MAINFESKEQLHVVGELWPVLIIPQLVDGSALAFGEGLLEEGGGSVERALVEVDGRDGGDEA